MEPRGENKGVRDEFFYPESTIARGAAAQRRPLERPRRSGSRLAWLLCVLLLAALAGVGVWVLEPMRRQLLVARAAQASAVAEVARLHAQLQATAAQAVPVVAPAPAVPAVDEDASWGDARRHALAEALADEVAAGTARIGGRGGRVLVELTADPLLRGEPSPAVRRLAAAIGRTLSADESPYRLALFVPALQKTGAEAAKPAPTEHRGRRRGRRGRHERHAAQAAATMAERDAAERAAKLVQYVASQTAQRPKSGLEGAFGAVSAAEGPAFGLQLRLERMTQHAP